MRRTRPSAKNGPWISEAGCRRASCGLAALIPKAFVEPDKTLISGDVVQSKVVPNIFREGGTPSSWIAVLGQVEKLGALHVLPDHSAIGDGSLVRQEKLFITDLQTRALDLKRQGVDADDAGRQLTLEFKKKYSDWPINNLTNFVKSIYAE